MVPIPVTDGQNTVKHKHWFCFSVLESGTGLFYATASRCSLASLARQTLAQAHIAAGNAELRSGASATGAACAIAVQAAPQLEWLAFSLPEPEMEFGQP